MTEEGCRNTERERRGLPDGWLLNAAVAAAMLLSVLLAMLTVNTVVYFLVAEGHYGYLETVLALGVIELIGFALLGIDAALDG